MTSTSFESDERRDTGGPRALSLFVDRGALVVSGEVDAATAPQLTAAIRAMPIGTRPVDLSGVTFFGAAGISALMHFSGDPDSPLHLVALSGAVLRTIRLTGTDELLTSRR